MATVVVTHPFVSTDPQGTDLTKVYGPQWNDDHTVTGLENVDNTSDVNKPVSTATQTALDLKVGLAGTETITGIKTFGSSGAVGRLKIAGTTSGTTILDATAVASGTLTLPAATDTLMGKATTDEMTGKTFDVTGAGNSFVIPYFAASLSTTQTPITNNTPTKVLVNSELADNKSRYDNSVNYRYAPSLAGNYRVVGHISCTATTLTELDVYIYKNGSLYAASFNVTSAVTALSLDISHIVAFNGSTDYVELWGLAIGTGTINFLGGTGPIRTWFEAQYVGA